MVKYIDVCKKIAKNLTESGFPLLKEVNLHTVFEPIYDMDIPLKKMNCVVCLIIFGYDPDSAWLDLKKDRHENKLRIIEGLGQQTSDYEKILSGDNEKVNDVIFEFLHRLTDWRWSSVYSMLEYHSKTTRFVNKKTDSELSFDKMNKDGQVETLTEDLAEETIAKITKTKGELLDIAMSRRRQADELIAEIKRDFVSTDAGTQADFNFMFSETSKQKSDIMSWRCWIRERNEKKILTSS